MSEVKNLNPQNQCETLNERDLVLQALHDLRSPLGVLKILLARLEQSPEAYCPNLVAAVFARIEAISETMSQTTTDRKCTLSLAQAIHAVLKEKTVEYGNEIRFQSNISPEASALNIPACEVMRLVSNLINNAVEAGATFIQVEVSRNLNSFQLSVSDDGRGFSDEALADLESGVAHLLARPGHGFGLRHARQLAASLNGQLWLRSLPKQGSCVTLSVPASFSFQGVEV